MIKSAPFRSVPLDRVAAAAGSAFAFDESAVGFEPRHKPRPELWAGGAAGALVAALAGWLADRFAG